MWRRGGGCGGVGEGFKLGLWDPDPYIVLKNIS